MLAVNVRQLVFRRMLPTCLGTIRVGDSLIDLVWQAILDVAMEHLVNALGV
jgi:hypothetical protein